MANLPHASMLFSQLDHTCTIQVGKLQTAGSDTYHPGSSTSQIVVWSDPTLHTAVRCRLSSVTSTRRFNAEITSSGLKTDTGGRLGTSIIPLYLLIDTDDAPATLLDLDSNPNPAALHRIVNVQDLDGNVVEVGPLDIQNVSDEGRSDNVLVLSLLKTPVTKS